MLRIVNELADLVEAELLGLFAKDEEDAVHDVGLPAAIGTDHRREGAVKGANLLPARIRFEILEH